MPAHCPMISFHTLAVCILVKSMKSHLVPKKSPNHQIHVVILMWNTKQKKGGGNGTSLVARWLRIRLPMQGTRVRVPVQEDPTCCVATKPVRHNY